MTIHSEHPFLPPPPDRDQGRRLRARLGGTVTLWTSGTGTARGQRAGLTISSLMLADGPTWQLLALLDPDSDLLDHLVQTGRAVMQVLAPGQENLADAFAGQAPAPGGPFTLGAWEQTTWGPRLTTASVWAGARLVPEPTRVGWSQLVCCRIEELHVGEGLMLTHHRGRYGSG